MVELRLKYGSEELGLEIPDNNFSASIYPNRVERAPDPKQEISRAIRAPIQSPKLNKIIKPNSQIVILTDDHTRATPSYLLLPPLLDELNQQCDIEDDYISVIFGCGIHRTVHLSEMEKLVGKEVLEKIEVTNHDCHASDQVYLGKTSFGNEVKINRKVVEADFRISLGTIGYHYFAGYTGGRKAILPGVASYETIKYNHSLLSHPQAKTGNLEGNPIHLDMMEGASPKLGKLDFITNVVMNAENEIVKAFAGNYETAFLQGTKLVDSIYRKTIEKPSDIVLVSAGGYPRDIDLYQAYKALDNVLNAVKEDGVIILVAECKDGHGHKVFNEWMKNYQSFEEMEEAIGKKFVLGGHKAYFLLKAVKKSPIILVSEMNSKEVKDTFKLIPSRTVEDAIEMAYNKVGKDAKILFVPYGYETLLS